MSGALDFAPPGLSLSVGTPVLRDFEGWYTVRVSGETPEIAAEADRRYLCGEVTSLSFTPCASGLCDLVFRCGESAAALTLPETLLLPEWFTVEPHRIYEISVADGVYGAVGSWPAD